MLGFAAIGLLLHSAHLYHRAIDAAGSPLSSQRDWYLVAAWALIVVYLYLVYYHPRTAFGLFLLPLALGLIGAAKYADAEAADPQRAAGVWGIIHGTSLLLATVAVLVGFAASLMYLGQVRRLKHKRPPLRGLQLPSLEWLQRTNARAIVVAALMLGVGVLSGIVLNRVRAVHLPWNDRVVLSTALMFVCLVIALAVGAFYKPAQQGRKIAYLTVVSFVFLVIALAVFLHTHVGSTNRGAVDGASTSHGLVPGTSGPESPLSARRPLQPEVPHVLAGRRL
jgi:ABC-type uncharacterized transport system permease subunit